MKGKAMTRGGTYRVWRVATERNQVGLGWADANSIAKLAKGNLKQ